ncbi:MFS transporter [Mesorhizobium sp. L-8-10]|uniref:MFS transporter n=1 Tax=Mesorhizobium sp. L-8-10 TaxID=2744523 RepID=UPI0019259870|nr:MFS transporter [Mesorhizobium sp. L-8-10]BCH35670.1 MFS transporter [Mesorhizobium sp. L-8-10]
MSTNDLSTGTSRPGWAALLGGRSGVFSIVLAGGVMLHALNIYIVTTILPSVVDDLGGLDLYAWSTTLFVVASILGAALAARLLDRAGSGRAYALATVLFAAGTLICAAAQAFPVLLAGRFVQGFGGGLLYALAYAVIRLVYPEALWSRAISLISVIWGVSTLVGPAVGGVFAEMNAWRAAFWSLVPVATVFGLVAMAVLPAKGGGESASSPLPLPQLALLAASVLAVSAGSVSADPVWNGLGMLAAVVLAALLVRTELKSGARLLPTGGLAWGGKPMALCATIGLLVMGMQTDVFVPYFLQILHGQSPLAAGYLAALMAMGWTLGSLQSAGRNGNAGLRAIASGPLFVLVGLAILAALVPFPGGAEWQIAAICAGLLLVGLGIGVAWPHLVTNVFREVPAAEQGLAAGSITTVQLFATAFGAAAAGMVANLGGLSDPGGATGAADAALWLFVTFLAAPASALISSRRILVGRGSGKDALQPASGV